MKNSLCYIVSMLMLVTITSCQPLEYGTSNFVSDESMIAEMTIDSLIMDDTSSLLNIESILGSPMVLEKLGGPELNISDASEESVLDTFTMNAKEAKKYIIHAHTVNIFQCYDHRDTTNKVFGLAPNISVIRDSSLETKTLQNGDRLKIKSSQQDSVLFENSDRFSIDLDTINSTVHDLEFSQPENQTIEFQDSIEPILDSEPVGFTVVDSLQQLDNMQFARQGADVSARWNEADSLNMVVQGLKKRILDIELNELESVKSNENNKERVDSTPVSTQKQLPTESRFADTVFIERTDTIYSTIRDTILIQDELPQQTSGSMTPSIVYQHTITFAQNAVQWFPLESEEVLREIQSVCAKNINYVVILSGYTDKSGSKKANTIVSQKRVMNVREKLIESGISKINIATQWFGEEFASSEDEVMERNVTIRVLTFQ